jgi:hypothetical protein
MMWLDGFLGFFVALGKGFDGLLLGGNGLNPDGGRQQMSGNGLNPDG